jgi:hypothetical protein
MGSQQLLLVILGVVIVGIAVAVGVSMMSAQNTSSRKDAMVTELEVLAEDARAFFIRPASMGGGGRTYTHYTIPSKLIHTTNGVYSCTTNDRRVFFTGTDPENGANTIRVTLARFGSSGTDLLTNWTYTGEFR